MIPEQCDILVVGAGPAGSCAALAAARDGFDTVLIDSKSRIGEPLHCAEFVPARIRTEFSDFPLPVVQRIDSMETRILSPDAFTPNSDGHLKPEVIAASVEIPSPGFLIDRARFDRDLARAAAGSGALVLSSTRLLRGDGTEWILSTERAQHSVYPKITIAADGALSSVAAALGNFAQDTLRGVQVEVPYIGPPHKTFIFLHKSFRGGYGWVFPKQTTANVGIGIVKSPAISPAAILGNFLELLKQDGLIRAGVLARWSGIIPVSGLRKRLVNGTVLFCGDAGGFTHPITGAGIAQAVISGQSAGRTAAKALNSGDYNSILPEYESEMTKHFRGVIQHARSKRDLMMQNWDDEQDFVGLCEKTWIAFKGYGKRERNLDKSREGPT
jgi:digeranylgeranylglycerophospholipid reductase